MTEVSITIAAKAEQAASLAAVLQQFHKLLLRKQAIYHVPLFFAKHDQPRGLLNPKRTKKGR